MLSYNCWLFSLDWGPGLFHFLLTNISLFCLWAPLSSPHLIWQFCLKSGCYYSDLVLEHSVVHVMWCDHELTRESSSEVFPLASLPEDFPVPTSTLGVTCGAGETCDSKGNASPWTLTGWDQLSVRSEEGSELPRSRLKRVLISALQALSLLNIGIS